MFDEAPFDDHEAVTHICDAETGLHAIIAIHSTALGPAAGGCRNWTYANGKEALGDALRLSRGMTFKNAMADLPLGGGKAVVLGPIAEEARPSAFAALGRAIDTLGGRYITAEDVGVSVADMEAVATRTRFVSGLKAKTGGAGGDPAPYTARGVLRAIETAAAYRLRAQDLRGIRIAIQGIGNVGGRLARQLAASGAVLTIADRDEHRADRLAAELDCACTTPASLLDREMDLFAPCALGGVLDEKTAARLRTKVIVGGANNQLASSKAGEILADRGILYAPDYLVNAGGIIAVASEYLSPESPEAAVLDRLDAIGSRLGALFALAEQTGQRPEVAADAMVQAKLARAKAGRDIELSVHGAR